MDSTLPDPIKSTSARSVSTVATPVDEQGWPTVPRVIDSDYRVVYIPAGLSLPNLAQPITSDMYIHIHMSGIGVLGLAEGHPILQSGLKVDDINWSVSQNTDMNKAAIKMSGKRKRGAPVLHPNSNICEIVTENHTFLLKSLIKARLVETNARALLTNKDTIPEPVQERDTEKQKKGHGNKKGYQEVDRTPVVVEKPVRDPTKPYEPPLLHTDPNFSGFLCLMIVTVSQINLLLNKMLTKTEYHEVLRQRAAHNNEIVTFRLGDLRAENGSINDIYAPNRSNQGQTWGPGNYNPPPKTTIIEENTTEGNVQMADSDEVSQKLSNKRPRDESEE